MVHQQCGMSEEMIMLILKQAQLSLDEPDLERIVEDLGALGISDNVEQSSPAAANVQNLLAMA
ncbi:hypothetical protein EJB05_54845, partial [Eragrostis curvula]